MLGADIARLDSNNPSPAVVSTASAYLSDYCLKFPMESVYVPSSYKSTHLSGFLTVPSVRHAQFNETLSTVEQQKLSNGLVQHCTSPTSREQQPGDRVERFEKRESYTRDLKNIPSNSELSNPEYQAIAVKQESPRSALARNCSSQPSLEDIGAQLQLFRGAQPPNIGLNVFTDYAPSGPSDEPLEISSETQRAMESSDGTPPSVGKAQCLKAARPNEPVSTSSWNVPNSVQQHPSSPSVTEEQGISSSKSVFADCLQEDKDRPASSMLNGSELNSSDSDEGMSMARFEQMTQSAQPDQTGVYFCHLCDFTGRGRQEFQDHLRSHYDYRCLKCDYTSRTEGRLKRHLKDFHSEVPPDNFSGKALRSVRPKLQRCKQCDFMTETKDEFWRHLRIHIKEDKRLECNLCCFVTEYKHHLEYHMRNHTGTKPYKCPKCNYECVNKSMLNSHMKSHSNIYPYRCANCHYATKYCHSLKLHLAKHDHKPAVVLNADGSLPTYDNTTELINLRRGSTVRSYRSRSNGSPKRFQQNFSPNFSPTGLNPLQHGLMMRELLDAANRSNQQLNISQPSGLPSATTCSLSTGPLMDPSVIFPSILNSPQIPPLGELPNPRTPWLSQPPNPSMMAAVLAAIHQTQSLWTQSTAAAVRTTSNGIADRSNAKLSPDTSFVTSSPCTNQPMTTKATEEKYKHQLANECALDLSAKMKLGEVKINEESDDVTPSRKGEVSQSLTESNQEAQFVYECRFCEIRFKHRTLYDIHMGFHSHVDPYLCNRCGHQSRDSVDFFIHLGQMAHYS